MRACCGLNECPSKRPYVRGLLPRVPGVVDPLGNGTSLMGKSLGHRGHALILPLTLPPGCGVSSVLCCVHMLCGAELSRGPNSGPELPEP
jgi:hypothetical protein